MVDCTDKRTGDLVGVIVFPNFFYAHPYRFGLSEDPLMVIEPANANPASYSYNRALEHATAFLNRVDHEVWHSGGFVYVARARSGWLTGYYKIGRTGNPKRRISNFDTPYRVKADHICHIETCQMYGATYLEATLHLYFVNQHITHEWYYLSEDDLKLLHGLAERMKDIPLSEHEIICRRNRELRKLQGKTA
jgi:hypothetical protein